jgi:hypothetical protein
MKVRLHHQRIVDAPDRVLINHNRFIPGTHSRMRGNYSRIYGNCTDIVGDCSNIVGDVSDMMGDVSGISGDVTGSHFSANGIFGTVSTTAPIIFFHYRGEDSYAIKVTAT